MTEMKFPFEVNVSVRLAPGMYRPVPQNPLGLRIVWLLFGATVLLWGILSFRGVKPPMLMQGTTVLLLLVALGITLSHWLDARTSIVLREEGMHYKSPLRTISLGWGEINELWCASVQGGWRFLVKGSNAAFRFQSFVEIHSGTGRSIRSGFPEGLKIAQMIVAQADLARKEHRDQILVYRKAN